MYEIYGMPPLLMLLLAIISVWFTIWTISSIVTLKKQVKLIIAIKELDIEEELEEEEG